MVAVSGRVPNATHDHIAQVARVIAPSDADDTSAAYLAKTPCVYFGAGGFHWASRDFNSASEISTSSRRFGTSKMTTSPSRTPAIGPPCAASGATWPAMRPWVAPLNRPSVTRATESPNPAPTIE